jgi:hypothetical protein
MDQVTTSVATQAVRETPGKTGGVRVKTKIRAGAILGNHSVVVAAAPAAPTAPAPRPEPKSASGGMRVKTSLRAGALCYRKIEWC